MNNLFLLRDFLCLRHAIFGGLMLLFLFHSASASAASCSSIFSGGAQSHSASGYLEMDWRSRISGSGTAVKVPSVIDDTGSGWFSCQTAACTATGNFNAPVSYTIPSSNGSLGAISVGYQATLSRAGGHYTTVNVGQEATLTFSTTNGQYYTTAFTTNLRSRVNFAPGDYFINGDLNIGQDTVLAITGSGTVRIFVTGTATFNYRSSSSNSSPANMLLYVRNSVTLANEVDLKAFVYSQNGGVTMNYQAKVTGGVSAAGRILMSNESLITYSSSASTADFGSICSGSTPTINNWNINVGTGSASTCSDFSVTISARDNSNNLLTGYTGTIAITTSTNNGDWKKTAIAADAYGTLTASATDNGQATYTYTAADAGAITLLLSNQHAQTLTIRVADASAGVNSTSANVTFAANAFVIDSTDSFASDVIAGRSHSFRARMMRRNTTNNTNCDVATNYNVPNVKMWLSRDAADAGGAAPVITRGAVTLSPPNSEPAAANINLAFSAGVATFTLAAADVGKYRLNITDTSNSFASSTISGQSDSIIARPFGIRVAATSNPGATDASGARFRAAGQAFTLTVAAVGWQSADDMNNDGIPDGHNDDLPANNANLQDNSALVSFGKEVPAEGVTVSTVLMSPTGGTNSGLSGAPPFTSFTVGTASTSTASFGEVGIIEIGARISDNDYLGSVGSAKIVGRSGFVGRFSPDHFRLASLSVTPACSSTLNYSYFGQDFSFAATMTAHSVGGGQLTNYRDTFVKFQSASVRNMMSVVDSAGPTVLSPRINVTTGTYSWSAGVLTANTNLNIGRSTSPDGPYSNVRLGFAPVDTDGVALRTSDFNFDGDNNGSLDSARVGTSTTRLRYGRLRLDDSYGPETNNLPVIFRTEYWDGSKWIQNPDDDCTEIALSRIRYPGGPINVTANRTTTVGAGNTTGEYANRTTTAMRFSRGDAGHYFTAPGTGNTGNFSVQVDLTDYPWLRFDWNNDGNYSDTSLPDARFTFGNYRGHDRVLYWIESGR